MKRNKIILALLSLAALAGNSALAATTTGTMQINTSVTATCQMITYPIDFPYIGDTNASSTVNTGSPNPIKLTCTKGTAYTLGISAGSSGVIAARSMNGTKTGNTDKLNYNIYKEIGRTTVVGDTGAAAFTGVGTGAEVITTIYPAVPANQFRTPDSYKDTLTVTVTY